MNLRTLASLAFLVGGAVWVGRYFLGDEPPALYWIGLGMLGVALAAAGASLVKKGAWWLRLVVGVALPALVWSLYSAIRPAGEALDVDVLLLDALCGGAAIVVAGLVIVLAPARERHHHGTHAR